MDKAKFYVSIHGLSRRAPVLANMLHDIVLGMHCEITDLALEKGASFPILSMWHAT